MLCVESFTSSQVVDARYRLGQVIGRGGMADVWTADDLRLERRVALKSLRVELAEQDGIRERFQDEARAAARLSHPNVVGIFDTGTYRGVPYLVMELLPGTSLADLIAKGPIDSRQARQIGVEVLGALRAAHAAGLVHRDIKPANVLLAADGTAKVADFGIAKSAEAQTHTATGLLLGTPGYLPPERLAGEPATARSDLYAVGVLLYELLTGSQPFTGDSPLLVTAAIERGEHRPLRERRPDVDRRLAEVVERAMDRDPARRFVSAAEMAVALVDGAPADPGAPSDPGATVVVPEVAGGESTVAGAAAGGAATRAITRQRPTEVLDLPVPPSDPPPGRRRRPDRSRASPLVAVVVLALVLVVGALVLAGRDGGPGGEGAARDDPASIDGSLPEPLARALDELEAAVRP